jgi:ribosomal protein S11
MGPPAPTELKQPVVGAVTHKSHEELKAMAQAAINSSCPAMPAGHRSMVLTPSTLSELTHHTKMGWLKRWREEIIARRDNHRYLMWLKDRSRYMVRNEDADLDLWLRSRHEPGWEVQRALGIMERIAPSRIFNGECALCEKRARSREAAAKAAEAMAVRQKRQQALNPYGLTTITLKLKAQEALKNKAIRESAGSAPAKIRVPVIRATSPVNSNEDSRSGGDKQDRDNYGFELSAYTNEERKVFLDTYEGRQVDIPWWRNLKNLKPSVVLEKAMDSWVSRGQLLVPPSYG